MSEQPTKVYGIDLGTTYSCIARVDEHGKAVIIPNEENERITPSVVFFDGGDVIVGNEAKANGAIYPDQVVPFVKRAMGDPNFLFQYNDETYKPEEISALILRKLVKDAEQNTGDKVTDVVITVPAYFGINEREATKIAGDIAGLNVRQIINEPTAAAISYGMSENTDQKVVLVYDLGGGTFDITMIAISAKSIEVICTGGDHNLGGKDWDDIIIQYLVEQFQEQSGSTDDILEDRDTCQALQLAAEKAKKALSVRDRSRTSIVYGGHKIAVELTRDKFDEITGSQLDRTVALTRDMLEEAKKKGYDTFDEFLLVGGSSRMPQVMEIIKKEFNVEPKLFDPDEAVAKGAALAGWKQSIMDAIIQDIAETTGQDTDDVEGKLDTIDQEVLKKAEQNVAETFRIKPADVQSAQVTVKNVCSKSFGIVAMNSEDQERVCNLVKKNTTVPVVVTQPFGTYEDNQSSVNIRVMENEVDDDSLPPENATEIGVGPLEIPPGLPAGSPIEVTFTLNEEGRLDIKAVETTDNRVLDMTIKTESVLSKEEVTDAIAKGQNLSII